MKKKVSYRKEKPYQTHVNICSFSPFLCPMFNLELDNLSFKFVLNIKIGPRTVLRCFYKSFMPSCFERFGAHWPHLSLMHESYSITLFSSYFFF